MRKRKVIAFAGLDGSGKSTQISVIKKRFEENGLAVKVVQHFDTPIGQKCKEIIRLSKDAYIRALAFALDEYSQKIDNSDIADYDLILWDRSHYCAIAYSGAQGISELWLHSLYQFSQEYDLCLYLDISPETSYSRKGLDDISPQLRDTQFAKVRELYLQLAQNEKIKAINAEQEFEKVTSDIEDAIWEVLRK
mgnify:CR=1 FL=1